MVHHYGWQRHAEKNVNALYRSHHCGRWEAPRALEKKGKGAALNNMVIVAQVSTFFLSDGVLSEIVDNWLGNERKKKIWENEGEPRCDVMCDGRECRTLCHSTRPELKTNVEQIIVQVYGIQQNRWFLHHQGKGGGGGGDK